jgi:hypothetical protein
MKEVHAEQTPLQHLIGDVVPRLAELTDDTPW